VDKPDLGLRAPLDKVSSGLSFMTPPAFLCFYILVLSCTHYVMVYLDSTSAVSFCFIFDPGTGSFLKRSLLRLREIHASEVQAGFARDVKFYFYFNDSITSLDVSLSISLLTRFFSNLLPFHSL